MHRVQPKSNGTVTHVSASAVPQRSHVMAFGNGTVRHVAATAPLLHVASMKCWMRILVYVSVHPLAYAVGERFGIVIHVLVSVLKTRALLDPSHWKIASALLNQVLKDK